MHNFIKCSDAEHRHYVFKFTQTTAEHNFLAGGNSNEIFHNNLINKYHSQKDQIETPLTSCVLEMETILNHLSCISVIPPPQKKAILNLKFIFTHPMKSYERYLVFTIITAASVTLISAMILIPYFLKHVLWHCQRTCRTCYQPNSNHSLASQKTILCLAMWITEWLTEENRIFLPYVQMEEDESE